MLSLTKVTPHTQSDNNVEKARWRQSLPGKNKKCIKTTCWKTDRKSLNSDISWSVFGNLSLEGLSEYFSTRRMATYNEVVLTKFASNYTTWWHNHSKCWSRLLCPQKIQLESRRTSAVLIRRMATYNEVVLTKVASNHHWVVQILKLTKLLQLDLWRTWDSWQPFWVVVSSSGIICSNFC